MKYDPNKLEIPLAVFWSRVIYHSVTFNHILQEIKHVMLVVAWSCYSELITSYFLDLYYISFCGNSEHVHRVSWKSIWMFSCKLKLHCTENLSWGSFSLVEEPCLIQLMKIQKTQTEMFSDICRFVLIFCLFTDPCSSRRLKRLPDVSSAFYIWNVLLVGYSW